MIHKIKLVEGASLGIFSASNKFRKLCAKVCQHLAFDILIIIMIIVSSCQTIFDSPLIDPNSTQMRLF